MEQQLNSLRNHFSKNIEEILPETELGKELQYKMSLALNLPLSASRTKVQQIQRIRPFKEINPSKVRKQVPYEEFWLPDYEIKHLSNSTEVS